VTDRFARAKAAIEKRGILLVYPLTNRAEPRSLWSELHPKSAMRWEWDEGADGRISALWRLREQLATSGEVVYAKWFRGRATFFSRAVFRAILASLAEAGSLRGGLARTSVDLLELLEDNSPQSTKELRAAAGLQGRANEGVYTRSLKQLWQRLLVVGVGEVDDGAFPSLAMSATRLRFEELLPESPLSPSQRKADAEHLAKILEDAPLFAKELAKARASLSRGRARPDDA
jgi:hypothetical protein